MNCGLVVVGNMPYRSGLTERNSITVTNHSSKSFKPQLEDIKSSYLLLNSKKKMNRSADNPSVNGNKLNIPKPSHNEDERVMLLQKIKQKYKSKQFWNDSKYDKIEGLNWISWN